MRPVLYLDIDDTILSWATGEPRPAPSSRCFLLWAMDRFEVRWLTRWCPSGHMPDGLVGDLSKMVGVDASGLRSISGCSWEHSEIKANGIAWLEHTVLGRDFAWVEDPGGVSDRDLEILGLAGYRDRYIPCNVTEHEADLDRVQEILSARF